MGTAGLFSGVEFYLLSTILHHSLPFSLHCMGKTNSMLIILYISATSIPIMTSITSSIVKLDSLCFDLCGFNPVLLLLSSTEEQVLCCRVPELRNLQLRWLNILRSEAHRGALHQPSECRRSRSRNSRFRNYCCSRRQRSAAPAPVLLPTRRLNRRPMQPSRRDHAEATPHFPHPKPLRQRDPKGFNGAQN